MQNSQHRQVNPIPEAQLKEISNVKFPKLFHSIPLIFVTCQNLQLLQARNDYQTQQQKNQIQPPVAHQPIIEEIPTSWGVFKVQKSSHNVPTFVAGEQKAAFDLKTRQFVNMQVEIL